MVTWGDAAYGGDCRMVQHLLVDVLPWMIRLETKVDDGVLCWQLGDEETVRMAR